MPLRATGIPIPVAALPSALPAPAAAPTFRLLPIVLVRQQQTNWCWAACCEMVFAHKGVLWIYQCNIVSRQFNANCCTHPYPKVCNKPEWPDQAYVDWGITFTRLNSQLSFADLQSAIDNGNPVEVYFVWQGSVAAHVALVVGWYDNGDVQVNDPWRGVLRIGYVDLQIAYGLGTWLETYTF